MDDFPGQYAVDGEYYGIFDVDFINQQRIRINVARAIVNQDGHPMHLEEHITGKLYNYQNVISILKIKGDFNG